MKVALAAALALIPSVAAADRLEVVGGGSGRVEEVSHTVDISAEPGLAVLRIQRTIRYTGPATADVVVHAALPLGGVVTGVSVEGRGEVEVQSEGDDALLFFADVASRSKRRIRYRVEVPLVAEGASATVWLRQFDPTTNALEPVVRLGGEVLLPADNPVWDPVVVPQSVPDAGRGRWGIAQLPDGWLWRTEVDAPKQLGEKVRDADVVFLLDVSRSQARRGIEVQLELLHEWARQMPHARYQVIAYHRQADLVFSTWKGADGIRDLGVGHAQLAPHNGSDLGAALKLAASTLQGREGPAFLVAATDGETSVSAAPKRMAALLDGLGRNVVTHLILASGRHTRGAIERRANGHRLAKIATEHGGMPVHVYLPPRWDEPPAPVALQPLLRVLRVDQYDARIDTKLQLGDRAGRRLYEGHSAVLAGRTERKPKSVVPSGVVWSKRWELPAKRSAAVDRRAAVFAANQRDGGVTLTPGEVAYLGRKLKFVTAQTALKATGKVVEVVTPRDTGVEPVDATGSRAPRAKSETTPPSEISKAQMRELFRAKYLPCINRYSGDTATLQVSLEMSWNEVLDVTATGADAATNGCVEEAIWAVDFPDEFTAPHAFGMYEEVLDASAVGESADDGEGPPQTEASRAGGCQVGPTITPWSLSWLLLLLPAYRRQRP